MTCPKCGKQNDPDAHFCFWCGQQIKDYTTSTSLTSKVILYSMSVLIPPFGIKRTIRYMRSPDPAAQRMGLISLVLTIVSIIVAIWLSLASFSAATTAFGL